MRNLLAIAIHPDAHLALSAGDDQMLLLWDLKTGDSARSLGHASGEVTSIAISPDGSCALVVTNDKTAVKKFTNKSIRLWCLKTGRVLRKYRFETWDAWGEHPVDVRALAISPDGRYALTGANVLERRDLASGSSKSFGGRVDQPVCISADGRLAAMGCDETVVLSSVPGGEELRSLKGHTKTVQSLAISPDSRFLVSGSQDKTLRLWEASTGQCLRTFEGHTEPVLSLAFSADSRYVVSGSGDATLRIWQLDWELEIPEPSNWDEQAFPHLEQFLTLHTPPLAPIPPIGQPTDGEIQAALTRRGKPVVTARDFEQLLMTLGRSGYGWLRPEGVKQKLLEMAANWNGPPALAE